MGAMTVKFMAVTEEVEIPMKKNSWEANVWA